MPAYVIAEFDAAEADRPDIARLDRTTRAGRFGERMLIDSSRCEALVGGWSPQRVVVLEFPTMERAQAWWDARERSAPPQMKAVTRKMILVEGCNA